MTGEIWFQGKKLAPNQFKTIQDQVQQFIEAHSLSYDKEFMPLINFTDKDGFPLKPGKQVESIYIDATISVESIISSLSADDLLVQAKGGSDNVTTFIRTLEQRTAA